MTNRTDLFDIFDGLSKVEFRDIKYFVFIFKYIYQHMFISISENHNSRITHTLLNLLRHFLSL